ncbi:MAG: hypothetical protein QNJ46_17035 [Leptolyngbyaceae cyanobacterium MO_188.B28]|nr:hypothetical protein [Leptolyngbyaceae cyanobacterium MO_188.B28]
MLIDLETTIFQIINFLILVALLKRFLYGPITRAMAKRQEQIAATLENAAAKEELAQQEAECYRQKQQALDAHREELLTEIRQQVEEQRQVMLKQAREEVDGVRSRWHEAVQKEKQVFLHNLRQQAGRQLAQTTRHTLNELANASLEKQIVDVFINRLHHLNQQEQQALQSALATTNGSQSLIIHSTFPLPQETQFKLIEAIQGHNPSGAPNSINVEFNTQSDTLCGIELKTPGYKLAWNLDYYLEGLEENLARVLENGNRWG